jgi:hypothetical protein
MLWCDRVSEVNCLIDMSGYDDYTMQRDRCHGGRMIMQLLDDRRTYRAGQCSTWCEKYASSVWVMFSLGDEIGGDPFRIAIM